MFGASTAFTLGSLQNGLILASPLDDLTGLTADVSGNRYEGTVTGATRGEAGNLGHSFLFDGVDDNVQYQQAGLISQLSGLSEFAVSLEINCQAFGADECVFSMGDGVTDDVFAFYPAYDPGGMDSGDFVNLWMNGSFIMSIAAVHSTGVFVNHIINQTGASSREIFTAGASLGTDTSTNSLSGSLDSVQIGGYGTPVIEEFPGNVGYLRIWDRSLTAEEIARLQIER